MADPGGVRGVHSNPPLAHSLVWKIPIWTFTFAQKYLSGNLRTPPRTPLHRILDPPQDWYMVLVNRWSIHSHIKLSANYIDFHLLAKVTESSFIYCSSISNINRLIVIDWYRLALILIDWQFHRLHTPGVYTCNSICCQEAQEKDK